MDFRLLGPLEVDAEGLPVSLGGARARALLALLLVHRNEVVPLDRIVDELWAEPPPKTADQVVRVYVSKLRKALEPAGSDGPPQVILTRGSGYLVRTGRDEVDVDRFDALRVEGRRLLAAGNAAEAADALGDAISLWRGAPLQEFAYERFATTEIARLEELRLATLEDLFDARLAAGHDSELVADLEQLVEANPLRERLRAQLMVRFIAPAARRMLSRSTSEGDGTWSTSSGSNRARVSGNSKHASCNAIAGSTGPVLCRARPRGGRPALAGSRRDVPR
jgi:DNA-binding SARP family transcriptional activator